MDEFTPHMRHQAAEWALQTLHTLGRQDLIPALHIEWKIRLTSSMGDAIYIWCDANGGDFPSNAMWLLKKRQYSRFLTMDNTILRAVRVRFSIPLWPRATERERYETVVHEICHLVSCHEAMLSGKCKIKPHGREWKMAMIRAGVSPRRCHRINSSGLGQKKIPCTCGCGDHFMTPLKAGMILDGFGTFTCRACGENIAIDKSRITKQQIKRCQDAVNKRDRRRGRRRGEELQFITIRFVN